MNKPNTTWTLLTASSQGAIAIVQLAGDVEDALCKLTEKSSWSNGRLHLVAIQDIDEVIAVKISDNLAQIMSHGGMQVLRKLAERLANMGIEQTDLPCYPEAGDAIEESMLHALAIAESPLAVDVLLQQPTKLRNASPTDEDILRSVRLNRLITPPKVVLLGAPNTGKSTLMNAMTRQDTSIVHDLPGATRDAVGARVNCAGLVVDLYDLPGFRETDDTIEQSAIALATSIAREAALTILIADVEHEWIETTVNTTLRIGTKADIAKRSDADISVSAVRGEGLQELSIAIRDALVAPDDVQHKRPWFFDGL